MALNAQSEFIFIGKGDESFLENYSYELSDDPTGEGGRVFMALEVLNNQAEAEDLGEAIFTQFRKAFFDSELTDGYERFEEALKAANQAVDELREKKVTRFIGNLNVAVGAVINDNLYISSTGDAEVYLVRKKFVSIVSDGLAEDARGELFVNIANGSLERGDVVLLSSSRLVRYITKGELGKLCGVPSMQELGQALGELQDFLKTEILGRIAVIGLFASHVEEQTTLAPEPFEKAAVASGGLTAMLDTLRAKVPALKNMPQMPKMPSMKKIPGLKEVGPFFKKITSAITDGLSKILPRDLMAKVKKNMPKALGGGSEQRSSRLRMPTMMPREKLLFGIVGLLVLLVGGVFWLRATGGTSEQIAEQQAKLNHVRELVNEAGTVGQFDKAKASDMLATAEQDAMAVLGSRFLRSDAVKVLDEIQAYRDNLDEVKRITNPTVAVDLTEKRSTASALGLLSLKDKLFSFEYNALYEIVLDKLQDPLTISDVETVILGASFPERNSLVFLTRIGKLIEYAGGGFKEVATKDSIWKKGVDLKSYNERLYLLDPERNQIWRYQRRREEFDVGEAYNKDADLKKAVSLAIDANIYVLNSDGTMLQMYQGQKKEFPLRRSPITPMTTPTKIYTAAELNFLFILEPSRKRVLLYRKDPKNGGAQYQMQYVFDNVGALRDLVVTDNRLYVMDDKRVYFVNLTSL